MQKKRSKTSRAFRAIATGGASEALLRVKRKRHGNLFFDKLQESEQSYDPTSNETGLSNATFDHTNIHDRSIESFLGQEPVKNKMIQYVRMHGYEPSSDPKTLAGQCEFIKDELKKKYAKERMKNFISKADWDRYVQSGEFDRDAEAGIQEMEKKKGFAGFDDQETEKFLPLIAGGVAMLAKSQAVRGVVSKVGSKVKNLVQKKKLKKQAIAEQNAKADANRATAQALQAGVPASTIAQIRQPDVLQAVANTYRESSEKGTSDQSKDLVNPKGKKDNTMMYAIIGSAVVLVVILVVTLKK
jgi:hypothetical protein